jgi:hypothetical protein
MMLDRMASKCDILLELWSHKYCSSRFNLGSALVSCCAHPVRFRGLLWPLLVKNGDWEPWPLPLQLHHVGFNTSLKQAHSSSFTCYSNEASLHNIANSVAGFEVFGAYHNSSPIASRVLKLVMHRSDKSTPPNIHMEFKPCSDTMYQKLQVPWDPGGSLLVLMLHRLEGKPILKKGRMS